MVAAQIWISWFGSSIFDRCFPMPKHFRGSPSVKKNNIFLYNWIILFHRKVYFSREILWYSISTISLYMWYIRSTKASVSSAITLIVICILISIACSIIVVSASSRHLIAVWFSSTPTSCSLFSLFGKNAFWFWYTMFSSEILILDYFLCFIFGAHDLLLSTFIVSYSLKTIWQFP